MTIYEKLKDINDRELIIMCQESEEWRSKGRLCDGRLREFVTSCPGYEERDIEHYVLDELLNRFEVVVPILLKNYPRRFIK